MSTRRAYRISKSITETVTLYRVVFGARFVLWTVIALLFSILLQPLQFVYANETEAQLVEEPVAEEIAPEPEPEPVVETVPETNESEIKEIEAADAEESTDESEEVNVGGESIDAADPESDSAPLPQTIVDGVPKASTSDEVVSDAEPEGHASSTDVGADPEIGTETEMDVSTSTETASSGGGGSGTDPGTTTDDLFTDTASSSATTTVSTTESEEFVASSTESVVNEITTPATVESAPQEQQTVAEAAQPASESDPVEVPVVVATSSLATTTTPEPQTVIYTTAITDSNRYQFSADQCVLVDDGSYYCHTGTAVGTELDDKIYAAQDSDGDLEIFARIGGEVTQITNNFVDDAAPAYDATSETITWHRLISGTYQIMQYAYETEMELQLTNEDTNSMEPDADGHYVAWQFWDGTDWEIVLYDGVAMVQLTTNDVPDLSPSVHDGYVLWTTAGRDGGHAARVYNIETGSVETIEDADGGTIANPRFVLVYDTKYDNGDVVTKGFDVESGVSAPLSAMPGELPTDLPDPEPTEEVRALIQTKTSKEEIEVQSSPDPKPATGLRSTSSTASVTAQQSSVDESATSTAAVAVESVTVPTAEPLELTEYDLIVEPLATSTQSDNSASTENLVE